LRLLRSARWIVVLESWRGNRDGGSAGLNEARTRGIDLTKQFGHG
jgi:hypothetical protein